MKKISLFVFLLIVVSLTGGFYYARAIGGPGAQSPGSGTGSFLVDLSTNVLIGTSTNLGDTRLLIAATSTGASSTIFAIRVVDANNNNVFVVRNDGRTNIGTFTFPPVASSTRLRVGGAIESTTGGFVFPDGTVQTTAGGGMRVSATGTSAGAFGANTGGGNYSFPASLGIGTTTPAELLHVYGGAGVNGGIKISSNTGFVNNFLRTIDGTYTDGLQIQKGDGTALMSFDNTNLRVGVGTTTPGVDFHVEKSTVGNVELKVRNTDTGASQAIVRVNADHAGSLMLINRSSGQSVSYLGRASNSWSDIIGASGGGSGLAISTNSATPLVFGTNATERFRIDSAGLLTVATNRITGLSTPTGSTDAATKGYVDTALATSSVVWAGYTTTTYTGNMVNWKSANALCNANYSGSVFADFDDMRLLGNRNPWGAETWLNIVAGGSGASNCDGWTNGNISQTGYYTMTTGYVDQAGCNQTKKLACVYRHNNIQVY